MLPKNKISVNTETSISDKLYIILYITLATITYVQLFILQWMENKKGEIKYQILRLRTDIPDNSNIII